MSRSARNPLATASRTVGRALHDWFTGRPETVDPRCQPRTTASPDAAGGYLLSPRMSQMTIDLARPRSVVMKAGAQTIKMDGNELRLGKVDADPTPALASGSRGGSRVPADVWPRHASRKTLACVVPISSNCWRMPATRASVIESVMGSHAPPSTRRLSAERSGVPTAGHPQ